MAGWTNLTPSAGTLAAGNAYLYEDAGALKYQGTSGSAATIVAADGTLQGGNGGGLKPPMAKYSTQAYPGVPGVAATTVVNQICSPSTIYYSPFTVSSSITLSAVRALVQTAGTTGGKCRLAIYNADINWQPTSLVSDLGEIAMDTTGAKSITGLSVALPAGNYVARIHGDASATGGTFTCLRGTPSAGIGLGSAYTQLAYILYKSAVTYAAAETPGTQWTSVGTSVSTLAYFFTMEWS
jgi:hypothetical protein